jgi:intracellular septation protein
VTKSSPTPGKVPPSLRFWLDLGPLLLFFAVNLRWGIFAATALLIPASLLATLFSWRLERRVSPMTLYTSVAVLVFGGLTLALRDERFIKVKLSVIYLLLAGLLGIGLLRGKLFLRALLGESLRLSERGWRVFSARYAGFFLFLALLNEVLRRTLSTDGWVNFKVFGVIGLTVLFTLLQAPLLRKHGLDAET